MIQKFVQDPLSEIILSGRIKDGEKVSIAAGKAGIKFNGERLRGGVEGAISLRRSRTCSTKMRGLATFRQARARRAGSARPSFPR